MSIFSQSHSTPRIQLFFIAILFKIVASALSAVGFVLLSPAFSVSGTVIWLFFSAVLLLVASPGVDVYLKDRMRWLRPAALTITIFFCVIGLLLLVLASTVGLASIRSDKPEGELSRLMVSFDGVFGYNDATALTHQAAENLLDGKNPYAVSNIVSATIEFNGATDKLTPLREGKFADVFPYPTAAQLEQLWQEAAQDPSHIPPELESKFNYPAGCFLLPAPLIWLGVGDLRFIYLIFIIPALVYVTIKVPKSYRLFFIAALIVSVEIWSSLAAGETGLLYFPFLLLAWVLYRRNLWASALFMAVAVATKQITWFFLPFYLIVIFRTMGWRRVLSVVAIIIVVFIAANAWFFASDPSLWLSSIFAPVAGKMFPLGVGVISLVTGGLITVQSPLIFSIMEFAVFALAIIWYFFYCRRYPHTAPVLAVLPLFFAWRSLWGYFFYIDIIVLAAILINEYGAKSNKNLEIAPALTITP
jgi:hypothetical protein